MPFDPPSSDILLRTEQPADAPAVEALVARAFGPGRFTKVSERVREIAAFRRDLSVCATADGALVGSVRMWDVRVGGRPAIFLGPLAVDASRRGSGTGGALVERACEAAAAAGARAVLLVGDPPLFERFGFSVEAARDIVLPGAVDQKRVMLRALAPGLGEMAGLVTADA